MALDLPQSPSLGDIHQGENGINYEWDGEKWVTYIDPASGVNVWQRDNATDTITPINDGDTIAATDATGTQTIQMMGTSGEVRAQTFAIHLLDTLPDVP